jgi:hypothetical protein
VRKRLKHKDAPAAEKRMKQKKQKQKLGILANVESFVDLDLHTRDRECRVMHENAWGEYL